MGEKLQSRVDQLSGSVDQANLQISLKDEALKVLQHSLAEKSTDFEAKISSLKEEHEDKLESVNKKYETEIEKLKKDAQLEIHEMMIKHQEELSQLLTQHKDEKNGWEALQSSSDETLKTKLSEQESKLREQFVEEKAGLTSKLTELSSQVKSMEDTMNSGSDYKVKMAHSKMSNLQQEVDSLKTVLEMRTGEIHTLRTDKVKLEEKLELYDQQQLTLRKMSAQVCRIMNQTVKILTD